MNTPVLNVLGRTVAMQRFILRYLDGQEHQATDAVLRWAGDRTLPFGWSDAEAMLDDIEAKEKR